LPHVENGTFTLIGATTENPSFSVNSAVLSRSRVLHLKTLDEGAMVRLLRRALGDQNRGLGKYSLQVEDEVLEAIARHARGDARRALGTLEAAVALLDEPRTGQSLSIDHLERAAGETFLAFDKAGEEHYNVVSAFIKSMRGTDPDASIYWMMRMLDAGEDPLFVLRRLIIFASEDVGNADPRALEVAVNADHAFRRMGMPEGLYPLAHACLYLASCPKSNSVGKAYTRARAAIERYGALPVPLHLRNAPTRLMKDEGYGQGYSSAHDHPGHYLPGATYLPPELAFDRYYEPDGEGLETKIAERLRRLRGLDESQSTATPSEASEAEAPTGSEASERELPG
jgi:putative ATPase